MVNIISQKSAHSNYQDNPNNARFFAQEVKMKCFEISEKQSSFIRFCNGLRNPYMRIGKIQ
jgi:hypothetical protein